MSRLIAIASVVLTFQTGCSAVMVIRQPEPLDRSGLVEGAERARIVGVLGRPIATEEDTDRDRITDTYAYTDGGKANTFGGKAGRLVLYVAGDVFTIFLAELIWIPAEMLLDGTDYSAVIDYTRRPSDNRWTASRIDEFERK